MQWGSGAFRKPLNARELPAVIHRVQLQAIAWAVGVELLNGDALLVNGRCGLPSVAEMNRAIDQERITIQKLYPDSPRYGLELDPVDYRRQLARVQRFAKSP